MGMPLPPLQSDLTQADLHRLMSAPEVAMDTETLGLEPRRDALCLVQICDDSGIVNLIRAPRWQLATNLGTFLASGVQKVFHNALFDCSMLLWHVGVEVQHPYCTRLASKLARTYASSHSLKTLVQEMTGVSLAKELQVSDWGSELSEAQLRYAIEDVTSLLQIKHWLEHKLACRPTLAVKGTYAQLNSETQALLPALVKLKLSGWNVEGGSQETLFGH